MAAFPGEFACRAIGGLEIAKGISTRCPLFRTGTRGWDSPSLACVPGMR